MLKKGNLIIFILAFALTGFVFGRRSVFAEIKSLDAVPKKLTPAETQDAPELSDNVVYPAWGVPCTKFTYQVVYRDKKGRAPTYVRINLNGKWYDMQKQRGDYQSGALYVYHYAPTSTKNNFFYFEASNGKGKARAGIIDSPDQGPTVLSEKFDNNQIILLDKTGKEIWTYDTGKDRIMAVSISKTGNYIVAATNFYIYLFSPESSQPLWSFCKECQIPSLVLGNFGGAAISADGNYIAASLDKLYFFKKESNQPLWSKDIESGAIGIDLSQDGSYIAVGTANADKKGDKIFLFNKQGSKIFEYRAKHPGYTQTGNFYKPDLTPQGDYLAVSTGCPDRRAYLFDNQGNLLFRSKMLTQDSPVHKSAISDDGSLIAYSADHMQGKEILFLFDQQGNQLWAFSSAEDSTARAVSISAQGDYIALGTSAGRIYLFSKKSNQPLWKFYDSIYTQIGDVKLNADGSLLAAGGTSKKIYLFSRKSSKPLWEYQANTWVNKIDFNGEYIVAGTGLSEYLGEGLRKIENFQCQKYFQPPSMEELGSYSGRGDGAEQGKAVCGDTICIPALENAQNCPQDCIPEGSEEVFSKRGKKGGTTIWQAIINFFKKLFKI